MVLLVVDVVIVSAWVAVDPMTRHMHNLTLEVSAKDRGVVYQPQVSVGRWRKVGRGGQGGVVMLRARRRREGGSKWWGRMERTTDEKERRGREGDVVMLVMRRRGSRNEDKSW